jgi:hypothetical protein
LFSPISPSSEIDDGQLGAVTLRATKGQGMSAIKLLDRSRIAISADQVSCDLEGEVAILNLKNSVYYGLDPVGASVWNLIQQPKTFAEIRDALLDMYEVDSAQLVSDLQVLLGELSEQGLIDIQT